jgi:sodium pump decarboxylase gamma subunit
MFMKKKIALLLSTILMVLVLGACGADPTTFEHEGVTYDSLYKTSNELVASLSKMTEEQLQQSITYYEGQEGEEAALVVEWCVKWLAAKEIAGDYVGVVEDSFTLTKSGKTVTTAQTLKFSDYEVTFELVYNYFDMEMTGCTIEPVYSIGEKMEKAALNTVICMSIVFVVLILISLIISCFKIFPYLEKRKAEKAKAHIKEEPSVTVPEANVETPQLTDDTELVAVIAAAIAASTGTSTSDFVVRSIRRR